MKMPWKIPWKMSWKMPYIMPWISVSYNLIKQAPQPSTPSKPQDVKNHRTWTIIDHHDFKMTEIEKNDGNSIIMTSEN